MARRSRSKDWSYAEERALIDNYYKLTIKELKELFPKRSSESINNKIKRLKAAGKITGGKDPDVVKRSYEQRGQDSLD